MIAHIIFLCTQLYSYFFPIITFWIKSDKKNFSQYDWLNPIYIYFICDLFMFPDHTTVQDLPTIVQMTDKHVLFCPQLSASQKKTIAELEVSRLNRSLIVWTLILNCVEQFI